MVDKKEACNLAVAAGLILLVASIWSTPVRAESNPSCSSVCQSPSTPGFKNCLADCRTCLSIVPKRGCYQGFSANLQGPSSAYTKGDCEEFCWLKLALWGWVLLATIPTLLCFTLICSVVCCCIQRRQREREMDKAVAAAYQAQIQGKPAPV